VRLTIAGAGMAGLCAAARARELGAEVALHEKGDRPGGSMLISSCVVWRYRTLEDFRRECPGGDERLQRLVVDRLDEGLEWLESLGAPVVWRETERPFTTGRRFDPRGLTDVLVRAAGDVRLQRSLVAVEEPTILATGGFQGNRQLVERYITPEAGHLWLRANQWSTGEGLRLAVERGAALSSGTREFYGRNLPSPPARIDEHGFVSLAQLYGHDALVVNDRGEEFVEQTPTWSGTEIVQATAQQPMARAWYVVDRRVANRIDRAAAERAQAEMHVRDELAELARAMRVESLPPSEKLVEPPFAAIHVTAGITHTIGGVRVDDGARVLREDGTAIEGLYAAGVDVGGIATGGYASGLAQALVLGRIAAETAVSSP